MKLEGYEKNSFLNAYMEHQKSDKERKKMVGERLQWLREKAGFSQREISGIVGVTPQTYSGYEAGKYEPSIESLIRLSFVYNVDMDFITKKWAGVDENKDAENIVYNLPDNPMFDEIMLRLHTLERQVESFRKKEKQ